MQKKLIKILMCCALIGCAFSATSAMKEEKNIKVIVENPIEEPKEDFKSNITKENKTTEKKLLEKKRKETEQNIFQPFSYPNTKTKQKRKEKSKLKSTTMEKTENQEIKNKDTLHIIQLLYPIKIGPKIKEKKERKNTAKSTNKQKIENIKSKNTLYTPENIPTIDKNTKFIPINRKLFKKLADEKNAEKEEANKIIINEYSANEDDIIDESSLNCKLSELLNKCEENEINIEKEYPFILSCLCSFISYISAVDTMIENKNFLNSIIDKKDRTEIINTLIPQLFEKSIINKIVPPKLLMPLFFGIQGERVKNPSGENTILETLEKVAKECPIYKSQINTAANTLIQLFEKKAKDIIQCCIKKKVDPLLDSTNLKYAKIINVLKAFTAEFFNDIPEKLTDMNIDKIELIPLSKFN